MESAPEVGSTRGEGGSRRELLLGLGLIGVAAAACGGEGGDEYAAAPQGAPAQEKTDPGSSSKGNAAAKGKALGSAAKIPVGGGVVFSSQKIVVTQPQQGVYKAFSAVCSHAGCTVGDVSDGTINCPCHGSKFKVADGSVADGPAPTALEPKKIKIASGLITLIQ
jgi:Rieske Fe-S protein